MGVAVAKEDRRVWRKRFGPVIYHSVMGVDMVEFTRHALDRMEQRGVSEADVLKTLDSPDREIPSDVPGTVRVRRDKSARVSIDVVYALGRDRVGVITVITITRPLRVALRRKKR
jgi:hypothetical protein